MGIQKSPTMHLKVVKPLIPSKKAIGRTWTVYGRGKAYMAMIDASQVPNDVKQYIDEMGTTQVYVVGRVIDETTAPNMIDGRIRLEFTEFCEDQDKEW